MIPYLGSDRVLNADDADAGEVLDDVCLIIPVGLTLHPLLIRRWASYSTYVPYFFVYYWPNQRKSIGPCGPEKNKSLTDLNILKK